MNSFEGISSRIWDVLFPKSKEVQELEAAARQNLRTILPRAKTPPHLKNVVPFFDYEDPQVKALIWEIKYRKNKFLTHSIAEVIADELLEELSDRKLFEGLDHPLILPIPTSKERRAERGFNQTELISHAVWHHWLRSHTTHIPNLLVKVRHTAPQTSLSRDERLRNLEGCFSVTHPVLIKDRHVILIDDVVTTGATIHEARKTLLESGARSVHAYVVAH